VDGAEIRRLLAAARRNLSDARIAEVSPETRFDAAYKCIMQAALAAMMAQGYRPVTDKPGHHQTVIQALAHTVGLAPSRVLVLDTLRRKRNVADYTGDELDESSVATCRSEADRLLNDVSAWLRTHRPELG